MKQLTLFVLHDCPHCIKAMCLQDQLKNEHPEFRNLDIRIIDEAEEPEYADSFDYYYVPTYYLGDEKLHEGIVDKKTVEAIMTRAISEED